jgi:iron complex outermembrane recepter protein
MNKLIHWGCAAAWSAASVTPTMANTETATQKYPPIEVRDTPLEYRQFDRVEVTGSAILSKEAKDSLPLQVINRRDIERSGAASLSEVLHQLPVMLNFTESGTMTGTLSGGPEAAAIHGNQSGTLVLLNGRRLPIYGSQTIAGERAIVDLNFLPLAAIERIEILSDGASSRYGSDAVAGVVNVITRPSKAPISSSPNDNSTAAAPTCRIWVHSATCPKLSHHATN